MGHILDPERDSNEDVWTLKSHPVDGITYSLAEEVRLAGWMWRLCPTHSQCVRQRQRSAKSAAVTVTTVGGHVGTLVPAQDTCLTRQRFPRSNPRAE